MSRTNKIVSKSLPPQEDDSPSVSTSASSTERSSDTSSSGVSSGSIEREDSSPTTESTEVGTLNTESSANKADYHEASTSKLMKEDKANTNSPGKKRKCTETSISNSNEDYKRLKSISEEILDVLSELVNGQKTLNDRLSAIDNTLSSNRSQINDKFEALERGHSVIVRNQGSLAADIENLVNNLNVFNEGVARDRGRRDLN